MLKLLLVLTGAWVKQLAFADCDFVITNYTNSSVTTQVGFYGSSESLVIVKPADTSMIRIKSDYKCNDSSTIGLGRSYVRFPKDPHGAGAVYSPSLGQLVFTGKYTGDAGGRLMSADNASPIWLNATGLAVDEEQFQLKLNFIARPNSRSAGTQ